MLATNLQFVWRANGSRNRIVVCTETPHRSIDPAYTQASSTSTFPRFLQYFILFTRRFSRRSGPKTRPTAQYAQNSKLDLFSPRLDHTIEVPPVVLLD